LLAASLTLAAACPRKSADTLKAGFSTERLARVDALLDSYVNDGAWAAWWRWSCATASPCTSAPFGWADKEAGRKMTLDTEFRIASQSQGR
jgi:CubicO group peptidase (beta-lactamase class C family)